jgi:hypothetical protein
MIASLTLSPFASLALTLLGAGALGAQQPSRPTDSPRVVGVFGLTAGAHQG